MSEINTFGVSTEPEPAPDPRAYPNKTLVFGRLVLSTGRQGAGAPVIDGCTTRSVEGWSAVGWCIRLRRTPGRALVVAWKGYSTTAQWEFIRRIVSVPMVGQLFRGRFS